MNRSGSAPGASPTTALKRADWLIREARDSVELAVQAEEASHLAAVCGDAAGRGIRVTSLLRGFSAARLGETFIRAPSRHGSPIEALPSLVIVDSQFALAWLPDLGFHSVFSDEAPFVALAAAFFDHEIWTEAELPFPSGAGFLRRLRARTRRRAKEVS